MTPVTTPRYRPVHGLMRGLQVLRALSGNPAGRASVVCISEETGIHRTTVKRLLETLKLAGMVRYLKEVNEYCLAFEVLQLSDGFRQATWISEIARPLMEALTRRVMWPSDLMIPASDEMMVCETTHALTPWSFNHRVMGARVPLLHSAGGRAYLAFCAEDERRRLLQLLQARQGVDAAQARDPGYVRRIVETARQNGFALSERQAAGPGSVHFGTMRCDAIAVPVLKGGVAVATLNIVYLARATSTDEVIRRHLPDLVETGLKIGQLIEARHATGAFLATPQCPKTDDLTAGAARKAAPRAVRKAKASV